MVISIPSYMGNRERRAILDSTKIGKIDCLQLMNEHSALALAYAYQKKDAKELFEDDHVVCFIDMGHSCSSISIAMLTQKDEDEKNEEEEEENVS